LNTTNVWEPRLRSHRIESRLLTTAEIGQEKAQSVIDSITSSYAAEGQAVPNPAMAPPGAYPPFGFPGPFRNLCSPAAASHTQRKANLQPGQFPPPFAMPPGPGGAPAMPPRTFPPLFNQTTNPALSLANNPLAPGARGLPFPPPFPTSGPGAPGGLPPLPNMPNIPNLPNMPNMGPPGSGPRPGQGFPPPPGGLPFPPPNFQGGPGAPGFPPMPIPGQGPAGFSPSPGPGLPGPPPGQGPDGYGPPGSMAGPPPGLGER
jgi:U1 small nuclear ribonucleoprotein C